MGLPAWLRDHPWTAALLLALPAVKWLLPPGALRYALFFAGGAALAAAAVAREGGWPRVRPLLAAPGLGLLGAVAGFAALTAGALGVLYMPVLQPVLPYALYDLAALFDPMPVYVGLRQGTLSLAPLAWAAAAAGALAEEWIFRGALFWRWLPAVPPEGPRALAGAGARLAAVSAYFAALHWPQPPQALAVALLGSLALGGVLLWKRNLALIAGLHVLFNWRMLLG